MWWTLVGCLVPPLEEPIEDQIRDEDGDGSPAGRDCDDADPTVWPGAPEVCGDDRVTDCLRSSDDGLVTVDGAHTFTDLGQAIQAAYAGSQLLICPGIYAGPFASELPIELRSHAGASVTALDGQGQGTTLALPGGSLVAGLTVTGGSTVGPGGGLQVNSEGLLTLVDSVVRGNVGGRGGGVALWGDAVIAGTVIRDNSALHEGGGLYVPSGTVHLEGSTVEGNVAYSGGGVFLAQGELIGGLLAANLSTSEEPPLGGGGIAVTGPVQLTAVEISANHAAYGAGLSGLNAQIVLTDVRVLGNGAVGLSHGGGAALWGCELELMGTSELSHNRGEEAGGLWLERSVAAGGRLYGNEASDAGGALLRDSELWDVVVEGNRAKRDGGGVSSEGSSSVRGGQLVLNQAQRGGAAALREGALSLREVELSDNLAEESGGALLLEPDAGATVESCALWRNEAALGGGAALAEGAALSSATSDWGEGAQDNLPADVWVAGTSSSYGADATFTAP